MNRKELIKKYVEFFKKKGHSQIENAPLVPKEDPTVLFTTAGMHPLVPFLLGQKHPQGKRLVNFQKCIRTGDIDEVGDTTHNTFFEMLGNWSLGDYSKKEAIEYSYEFLTKELRIPKEKLTVTCFKGDKDAPRDIESEKIWKNLGVKKIKFLGKNDNWWGPAGNFGPCGPDTEIFVDGIEIWNDVFMQYTKTKEGKFIEAKQKNIDTGMGIERTLAIVNGLDDIYETEVWKPLIEEIEHLHNVKYSGKNKKIIRVIADHVKAAFFIAAEGVVPSNKEHGYVLRKLIRRAYVLIQKFGSEGGLVSPLLVNVMRLYPDYDYVQEKYDEVYKVISEEENKFEETLDKGLKIFEKMVKGKKEITSKDSFLLFQSYGFPKELIRDLTKEKKIKFNEKEFDKEFFKHQKLSRTASAGRFKSGLADDSVSTTKLHTATHLLLESLKRVLKDDKIEQKGSNITPDRLRFDFSFPRKVEKEELEKVEKMVNSQIKKGLIVKREEMSKEKALKSGAVATFGDKYGDVVSIYSIGNFSKEICTGPHVKNTKEIGAIKIKKESSSSAGVRRIKAVLSR